MSDPTVTSEQCSRIHLLPLEIRSAIFCMSVLDDEDTIHVKPPAEKGNSQVLKILLTCKLFHQEAGEIFYQKNVFELVDIRYGIRDWFYRIGAKREILQQIHIGVDASDNTMIASSMCWHSA
jgi:hypothetical protein